MSEVLNGDSSHVTTPLVASITALSNNGSGAVRVTTSAPHLFGSGDLVNVFTSVISGRFTIAVIDATHFDMVGSTFTSTATGSATDLALTPQVQVPTDGDTASLQLSGMLSAQQAMLDRDQYLAKQLAIGGFPSALFDQAFTFSGGSGSAAIGTVGTSTILAETTAGPPCELQTSSAHHYVTGMTVRISGALGDTTINGAWPITVVDATHFTIPMTGAGGYTASSAHVVPIVPSGCHFVILEGWGGGGGGEGGGGHVQIADDSGTAFEVTRVQGGGGAGAKRRTHVQPVTPGDTWGVSGGAGGSGGAGATGAGVATAGNSGASLNYTNGIATSLVQFHGGVGGGAGEVWIVAPHANDAIVAFGGSGDTSNNGNRPWPRALGVPTVLAMWKYVAGVGSNIADWISSETGAGGPAVAPYATSLSFNASQPGIGQDRWSGGIAGVAGTDAAGTPNYIGGPGGGGGGAGPTGPGGAGGNGSNANGSGNSTVGGDADTTFATGATGGGGGGGGNAGAASGTVGNGGAGAAGDSGQITVCFIQTPTLQSL